MSHIINFIVDNIINLGILASIVTGLITYIFKIRSDRKVEYLKNTLSGLSEKLPKVIDFFASDIFKGNFGLKEWEEYYTVILTFGSRKTVYLLALLMQLMFANNNNEKFDFFLRKEFKFLSLYLKFIKFRSSDVEYRKNLDNLKMSLQFAIISLLVSSLKKDLSNINIISTSVLKCKITDFYQISTIVHLISINLNIKCLVRYFV